MNPRELVRRLAMQEDLNFLLTNRIPRHALTRFIGRFSRIRQPLIPGANDDDRNLDAVMEVLAGTRFRRISILPYHRIAAAKYQRLGLPNRMEGVEPPTPERIGEIRARFAAAGFDSQAWVSPVDSPAAHLL